MKDKKKLIKIISLVACICLVAFLCIYFAPNALADVGNNNRYDTGSSSSSSSSGDGGSSFFIFYFLFDVLGPIPTLIIIIIGVIVVRVLKKNGKLDEIKNAVSDINNTNNVSTIPSASSQEAVVAQIRAIDEAFSADAFIGWVREVFIKIQQAWSNREWKTIRPFESNELFSQHQAQLQEYINNNKINKIEKININYCALREFRQDGDKEVLVVELHAIMRDYVVDATTNKVLESDPNKDWHMKYLMTFNRKSGVKTKVGTSNKSTTNCPNCGAPTDITSSGQCKYCDSVITTGEHDWVLSDITAIR